MTEQNNELLLKNHEARLIGLTPFPEVKVTTYPTKGRGCGRGYEHGRGRSNRFSNHGGYSKNPSRHLKWERK